MANLINWEIILVSNFYIKSYTIRDIKRKEKKMNMKWNIVLKERNKKYNTIKIYYMNK